MPKRPRLEEGSFSHPKCASCIVRPATKIAILVDARWVIRQQLCDGGLVDFSFALQLERPESWRDVARWSVAHGNYHTYRYRWDNPRGLRMSFGLVNGPEDITKAYHHALQHAYPHTEKWLDLWWEGYKR